MSYRPLRRLAGAVMSLLLIAGCAQERSFEVAHDGSRVYLDDLSDQQKAEARARVEEGLKRGFEPYLLQPGDTIDVLYHPSQKIERNSYSIAVGDTLQIEFLYNEEFNRTVSVRPDGKISLPAKNPIVVAGMTPEDLALWLEDLYGDLLVDPSVSINVMDFETAAQRLAKVVESVQTGQGRRVVVAPDGTVSLPLLNPTAAAGETTEKFGKTIEAEYAARNVDVEISVLLVDTARQQIFVFGEVGTPGPQVVTGPRTLLMTIAAAGGVLPTGASDEVRVFYSDSEGARRVRSINLHDIVDEFRIEQDMLVPSKSVVYVPPTDLALAGRFIDQTLRGILLYNGFGFTFSYDVNQQDLGNLGN
ncbi:MAG: hypothetical protein CMM50_17835 [Rhodospirillaceae bacterium]|mgnify:CR=1 FL=1|nr:hypothetical protein [Rhodospirillaceae bacterium]